MSARGSTRKRGLGTADGASAGARGGGADLLAAAVQQLDEQARPVRLHGRGDTPVARGDLGQKAAERVRCEQPGRVHRRRLEHDQAGAAARAGLVVGDEVVGRQVVVDERRLVRGRDDPVLQLDRAERERAEQMLESRHRTPLESLRSASGSGRERPRLGIARDEHRLGLGGELVARRGSPRGS